jgi:hypothetical protein
MRKGRAVIMKIPNPNPTVLCTKLAPIARRNMYDMFSGIWKSVTLICVYRVSEHDISLIEVFAYKVKSHVDACHKIVVPHQSVCKIASQQGCGRSEDCIEAKNLQHGHRYIGSRTEREFSVQGEIPQYRAQECYKVTWPIAPAAYFIQQGKCSHFYDSGTGREECKFYDRITEFVEYYSNIRANNESAEIDKRTVLDLCAHMFHPKDTTMDMSEAMEINDMKYEDRIKEFENEQGDLIFECFQDEIS